MAKVKASDSFVAEMTQMLGPQSRLAQALRGFEPRAAQQSMARWVARCLQNDTKLVVEAGTGTGKTLAYLIPAVLSGRKVLVSTATKTLQEQIACKDLPLVLDALDLDLPIATMKGISNYLCLRRLTESQRSPQLFADPLLEQLCQWAQVTETGDRSELSLLPDGSPLWTEVSPTSESRVGPGCPFFEECFVTKMRRQAAAAKVVVVNHHLLLADLALKQQHPGAAVIPPFDALVVDEAHGLEGIATGFFGQSVSAGKLTTLVRDVRRAASLHPELSVEKPLRHLEERAAELFFLLPGRVRALSVETLGAGKGQNGTGSNGKGLSGKGLSGKGLSGKGLSGKGLSGKGLSNTKRARLPAQPLSDHLEQPYFLLDSALEAVAQHLAGRASGKDDLTQLATRAQNLRDVLALFAQPAERNTIFWCELERDRVTLHASPVDVGPLLHEALWQESSPMVLTSATLATPHGRGARQNDPAEPINLGFFRQRTGLAQVEGVDELVLPSPFDFAEQALVYVPKDLPVPGHRDFFLRASERMTQLVDITCGRALLLFTSYGHLRAARTLLEAQLDYPIFCQGDQPRTVLLERFRENVASVLLATASFWEGVDIPGESLSLVVMDKLPFSVPDDPLTAARMDRLREAGQDPFRHYQLPQAALALKQGFGRLIRHRQDRGVVAVLDSRLWSRWYSRVFWASLPPCFRTADLLRVRAFCQQMLRTRSRLDSPLGAS